MPKETHPTLVVFDIGNVLLRFSRERARKNFERECPGSGKPLVQAIWRSRMGLRFEKGLISGREFHRLAAKGLSIAYPSFCRAFRDIFTPIPENLRLLKKIARRHPTALLSNTNAIHWPYLLKTYPALRSTRWPLASHLLGAMKPKPKIYRELLRRTGFPARNVVYVDDHQTFVLAARRLGIRAVRYTGRIPLSRLFSAKNIVI